MLPPLHHRRELRNTWSIRNIRLPSRKITPLRQAFAPLTQSLRRLLHWPTQRIVQRSLRRSECPHSLYLRLPPPFVALRLPHNLCRPPQLDKPPPAVGVGNKRRNLALGKMRVPLSLPIPNGITLSLRRDRLRLRLGVKRLLQPSIVAASASAAEVCGHSHRYPPRLCIRASDLSNVLSVRPHKTARTALRLFIKAFHLSPFPFAPPCRL